MLSYLRSTRYTTLLLSLLDPLRQVGCRELHQSAKLDMRYEALMNPAIESGYLHSQKL